MMMFPFLVEFFARKEKRKLFFRNGCCKGNLVFLFPLYQLQAEKGLWLPSSKRQRSSCE